MEEDAVTEKLSNPIFVAVLFVAAIVVGMRLPGPEKRAEASPTPDHHSEVALTPKADLKTEDAQWTFAPNVPPAITRQEQRRLIVRWSIKENAAEIAPGVTYDDFWGFEGRVPGPMLRVREGDLVEVHLTNELKSTHTHNIDFHFVMGPGGGAAALSVPPGQEAVLEARAMMPGFYMFHCATPDIPTHIANGMYGYVLVEPAGGMPHADKEFYVVQSEIYTNDGEPGHKTLAMERAEKMDPQYVVFNGAVGSMLKDKAPHVQENQTVRVYVGNAGPNLISSFHVIGQIFDRVYREGDLISPPAQGLQTTLIPAGGSAVVEFTPRVPGTFLLVDHAIFRLHHGAVASVVVDGPQRAEIFEPMTDRNKSPMSVDSHVGNAPSMPGMTHPPVEPSHDAHDHNGGEPRQADAPRLKPVAHPAAAQPTPAPLEAAMANAPVATVKILRGSGIYTKGQTVNAYSPAVLTIRAGKTVVWRNDDAGMQHLLQSEHGEFTTPMLDPGDSFKFTFREKGTIHYTCVPHPWMKGTVIVR
jgi:copper-containing nitrite reductase